VAVPVGRGVVETPGEPAQLGGNTSPTDTAAPCRQR